MGDVINMNTGEVVKKKKKEDHKASITFEDINGVCHVRVTVDGLYLDEKDGADHINKLAENKVDSQAVMMVMSITKALGDHSNATQASGAYPGDATPSVH